MKPFHALFALVAFGSLASAAEVTVQTLSDKVVTGKLMGISEKEKQLSIQVGEETQKIPLAEVTDVRLPPNGRPIPAEIPYLEVRLLDGTTLKCQALALKQDKHATLVQIRLFNGVAVQTDLRKSVHWILCDAHDAKNRAEFEQMLNPEAPRKSPVTDMIRLTGRGGGPVDEYEAFVVGVNGDGTQLSAKFGNAPISLTMDRVKAIYLAPPPQAQFPTPQCWVIDSTENRFAAAEVTIDGETIEFATTSASEIKVKMPRDFVTRLDYTPGKIVWLSDVTAINPQVEPILSGIFHFGRDKNLEGGQISLGRKTFAKGLATHSKTSLNYNVAGYNLFRCWVGIDDIVNGPADAEVTIFADGQQIWKQRITNQMKPMELKLAIKDKKALRILVDYGNGLDLGDHVDFGDARITK